MKIYCCETCDHQVYERESDFCTNCGTKIINKVPSEFLAEASLTKWNPFLIGYAIVIGLGAIALIFNADKGLDLSVTLGIAGLVAGGLFLSIAGPFKESKTVLVDTRTD